MQYSNAWENGRITSSKCAINLCNIFWKNNIKLRLLSRTWPNISKLERTVLILRPSMFIAAVVKRLVPASLNAWKHRTASVQKGANGWKWPKPKKHWKNLQKPWKTKKIKKNLGKQKKNKKQKPEKQFSESLGRDPPPKSLEICIYVYWLFFLFFPFFLVFQGFCRFFQGFFGFCRFFPRFFGFPRFLQFFSRFFQVFPKCGVLQGNWHESQAKLSKCLWECSKTSVNHLKR